MIPPLHRPGTAEEAKVFEQLNTHRDQAEAHRAFDRFKGRVVTARKEEKMPSFLLICCLEFWHEGKHVLGTRCMGEGDGRDILTGLESGINFMLDHPVSVELGVELRLLILRLAARVGAGG